ncbi:response regulator transcription factor [Cohnella caldifontis]|uniref:response regulator transcription factor n=1 Tax=Cohnella caldifontis TaxID=3027471 RepID=UPI0023EC9ABE|nr:response regulator [Cohnella sp. YIM B05605]
MLLVDDEPLVLEGLKFMVDWQGHGFRVCGEASDGEEALERIQELSPNLVVTDIRMPSIDGLQLIKRCSEEQRLRCRFIILSGHEDFSIARQALPFGVIDYWLKPIDTDEIHRTLRQLKEEWNGAEAAGTSSESAPTPHAWSDPAAVSAAADETLHEAEDELLLAVEANDKRRIGEAANRLCNRLQQTFETPALRKSYLSHVLLDLLWKTAEWREDGSPSETVTESVGFLQNEPAGWNAPLESFCLEAAARLALRRSKAGPAGEAVRYIHSHYAEPLQLQTVARELHFQPAYLGQLFKKHVGMSFLDYLHRTRVEEAGKLLRRTDMKVADVARAVGYADPELFAAKFKKFKQVPPSQYKYG